MPNNFPNLIYVIPSDKCPTCHHPSSRAASGVSGKDRQPRPGDGSLCFYCGEFLVFDEELYHRVPDATEKQRFELSSEWKSITKCQESIRRHGPQLAPNQIAG